MESGFKRSREANFCVIRTRPDLSLHEAIDQALRQIAYATFWSLIHTGEENPAIILFSPPHTYKETDIEAFKLKASYTHKKVPKGSIRGAVDVLEFGSPPISYWHIEDNRGQLLRLGVRIYKKALEHGFMNSAKPQPPQQG